MALLNPTIIAAIVAWTVLYQLISRFIAWKRLNHIPGPQGAGWSKWWLVRHQFQGRICLDMEAVNNKYGMFFPLPSVIFDLPGIDKV